MRSRTIIIPDTFTQHFEFSYSYSLACVPTKLIEQRLNYHTSSRSLTMGDQRDVRTTADPGVRHSSRPRVTPLQVSLENIS